MPVDGGWAIALKHEKGELLKLSFPFDCMKTAQQFLSIANYRLGFIPSALPTVARSLALRAQTLPLVTTCNRNC